MSIDLKQAQRPALTLPGQGALPNRVDAPTNIDSQSERAKLVLHTGASAANLSRAQAWSAHLSNFLHQHSDTAPESALGLAAQKLSSRFSTEDLKGVHAACGNDPKLGLLRDVLNLAMQPQSLKRAA